MDIEIELSDEEWLVLFREAHRRDITLNQLVADILTKALDERR